jgi:hypothetical protein
MILGIERSTPKRETPFGSTLHQWLVRHVWCTKKMVFRDEPHMLPLTQPAFR